MVRAAPDNVEANEMRAMALCGQCCAWEVGPRSAAELSEAAAHFGRAAALERAPPLKAGFAAKAATCRSLAESSGDE